MKSNGLKRDLFFIINESEDQNERERERERRKRKKKEKFEFVKDYISVSFFCFK